MVRYGFGLSDIRQLYIDEFQSYFAALVERLEDEGILKKGATDKVKGTTEVNQLKKQIFAAGFKKGKSKK